MKQVLILGAGKSSSYLIRYLIENRDSLDITILIIDIQVNHLNHYEGLNKVQIIREPSGDIKAYEPYISKSYLTISLLPAFMHIEVAKLCAQYNSHLITPSYISEEMRALSDQVRSKGLIFLNELGFDPGIDHMTTMKIYNEIVATGGQLISYRSYAGGLVAAESDDNPWHYKFSWNPRNVILAGQGGDVKYKKNGVIQSISYPKLFSESEVLKISDGKIFDAYANRDSLKYEALYGWENIKTLLRGTLRIHGFCEAWALLVDLGLTDDRIKNRSFNGKTFKEFYSTFLPIPPEHYLETLNDSIREKLLYIGFLDSNSKITMNGSAAEILQSILVGKWQLKPEDRDWVVMVHFFEFEKNQKIFEIESYFSLEGENADYTAMSKTVGMPIAFAAEMILRNTISTRGVIMPTSEDIYLPILEKLKQIGIEFKETIKQI